MSARFRIRTTQGQEISFASHEMFAEFVRSGDLSPDDVVYDAETREWSSARTHPVVLQIELEAEEPAAQSAGEAADEDGEPGSGEAGDIGLDLAPAPQGLTPDEEAAAFVAKMEAERASDLDFDDDMPGFKMEKGASGIVGDLAPAPPPPAERAPPAEVRRPKAPPERREAPPERRDPPPERHEPPAPRSEPKAPRSPVFRGEDPAPAPPSTPARPKRKAGSGAARKYAPFIVVAAVAVGAGVYFGPDLFTSGAGDAASGSGSEGVVEPPPPPPPPLIPDTDEALRARAQERFLTSTQAALRGLDPIPDAWLRGAYLAEPSDYPQVPTVWEEYLTTIRQVRAGDDERYREAYQRALDDARVEGEARAAKLTSAMAVFRQSAARRAAHYDRVEALATAALRGHQTLVAAEGTIAYQPATGSALSGDPVIEAVGRSPQAQTLLNQVLDTILAQLHAERGPREAGNVREWVWDGLLDAVTS